MASEVELEEMIVRLTGDGSDYQRMMLQAEQQTAQMVAQVQALGQKAEESSKKAEGFVGAAVGALAAFGAGSFLKSAFGMFEEQETMQLRLKAAIESNGRAADVALASYKEFQAVLRNATGTGLDASSRLLQMAETQGIFGDAAERAVRAAVGLEASLGGSAEQYIRVTQAIETGNAAMLGRIPALRGMHGDAEKLAKAQELVNKSFAVAEAMGNSTAGVMAKYNAAIKGLTKQFGEVVAEAIKPAVVWLTQLIKNFTDLDPVTKKVIVSLAIAAAAIVAIGPAIGSVMAVAGPVLKLFAAGWTAISAAVSLVGLPLIAVGVAVGVLAAIVVQKLGGMQATWKLLSDWGAQAWLTIKGATLVLWEWALPYITSAVDVLVVWWNKLSDAGVLVWEWSKKAAADFWEWARPIVVEGIFFLSSMWEIVSTVAVEMWEIIKDVATITWNFVSGLVGDAVSYWTDLFSGWIGASSVTWSSIREFIVDAMMRAEFGFRNFSDLVGVLWLGVKYQAVAVFDAVVDAAKNGMANVSGSIVAMIAIADASWWNMQVAAQEGFNYIMAGWAGIKAAAAAALNPLGPTVREAFEAAMRSTLDELEDGMDDYMDVGAAAGAAFNRGHQNALANMGGTGPSALQRRLREEFEQARDALGVSWEEFRATRMQEIEEFEFPQLPVAQANARAAAAGRSAGSSFNGAANKEMAKFDAAGFFSAEAAGRFQAQLDRLRVANQRGTTIPVALANPVVPMIDVPNHSWYSIYAMPVIDIPTQLMPLPPRNLAASQDVLGTLLGDDGGDDARPVQVGSVAGTIGSSVLPVFERPTGRDDQAHVDMLAQTTALNAAVGYLAALAGREPAVDLAYADLEDD